MGDLLMSLLGLLSGYRKNLPLNRNEKTLYACIDGGLYLGPHLIAEKNNPQLGIATYRAVSLSGTDKLIVARLNSQSSVDFTQIDDGTMVVVINPDGLYASSVARIEDESNADNISFPEGVSVYMDGKATGFTAVAYSGVLYPLPSE